MVRKELEALSREELIARAEAAGIVRPRSLTTAELLDELVLRGDSRDDRTKARGWFGRARDLLKSALKSGLDLPETSSRVVKATSRSWPPAPPPPLPTVTLAEIYAAQGHLERALQVLGEVLAKAPDHAEATRLRAEYAARADRVVARPEESATASLPGQPPPGEAVVDDAASDRGASAAELPHAGAEAALEGATLEEGIDEIVAVAVDPSTVYLYWEVGAEAVARARVEAPEGALTVRTVTVAPGSDGPLAQVRDDRVDALSGELFVRGLRGGAHVRVSVGWLGAGGFVPLAVGADLSTPRSAPSGEVATEIATWSRPRGGVGDAPATRAPRFVGRPVPSSGSGRDTGSTQPPLATVGRAGGGVARRVALLNPTAVFDVSPGAPVPVGVWQPPGSSELSLIFGQAGARGARGGASDLVLGGASDRILVRSTS